MKKGRVLVAMSGGIDSSAVCLMLQEQGYEVVGMTMRVWDLPRQFSLGADLPDFIRDARDLAMRLGIEHHIVDVREAFRKDVVSYFIEEYAQGRTPNPCVVCNRKFKFKLLADMCNELHCDYMATGHYVDTVTHEGRTYLLMGEDVKKDQSYFLWRVPQDTLNRCLFPLGKMEKTEVRAYLKHKGFEVKSRQGESMEICFVENDYRTFLKEQCPDLASRVDGGSYVDAMGKKIGTHHGVPFYTVGQRKGLGIALGYPAYVLRLNVEKNTIVLGKEEDLLTNAVVVENAQIVHDAEFRNSDELTVRIRYHSQAVACRVYALENERWLVLTKQAVSAVTPGQSAVFYIGRRLVAGAFIASQKGVGGLLAAMHLS